MIVFTRLFFQVWIKKPWLMLKNVKQKLKIVHIIITYLALLSGAFVDDYNWSLMSNCYEQFSQFSIVINGSIVMAGDMKVCLL